MIKEKGYYEIYSITGSLIEKRRCESSTSIANGLPEAKYILRFVYDSGKIGS
jgi:hypothetical protein